jgi:hypothetical protein
MTRTATDNITALDLAVFVTYALDAPNWSGTPLVGGNVGGGKAERGNLTHLKRLGLITTSTDGRDSMGDICTWVYFTDAGVELLHALGADPLWGEGWGEWVDAVTALAAFLQGCGVAAAEANASRDLDVVLWDGAILPAESDFMQDAGMFAEPVPTLDSALGLLYSLQDSGVLTEREARTARQRLIDGCDAAVALADALDGAAWLALCARLDCMAVAEHILCGVGKCAALVVRHGGLYHGGGAAHGGSPTDCYTHTAMTGLDLAVWGTDAALTGARTGCCRTSADAYREAGDLHGEGVKADAHGSLRWVFAPPQGADLRAVADAADVWDAIVAAEHRARGMAL